MNKKYTFSREAEVAELDALLDNWTEMVAVHSGEASLCPCITILSWYSSGGSKGFLRVTIDVISSGNKPVYQFAPKHAVAE